MKIFKQLMIITGLFALFISPVRAFDGAILKGIEIDSPDGQNYRIIVKTTKDVPIKKYITAANKVVLDLENIRPAEYVNTLYNNATEVDHVIVQPFSGNKLRVFLQGQNIAAGKIILDTRDDVLNFMNKPEPIMPAAISRPKPEVASDSIIIDLSDKSVDKVKSVAPVTPIASTYTQIPENTINSNKIFDASIFDWALRFLMLAVVIIAGIKFFSKPKNIEIKLASEDKLKSLELQKELMSKSIKLGQAPKRPVNASVSQYGIREYKNSQLPPVRPALKPRTPVKAAVKQPVQAQTRITKKQTQKAKENFDGTKFLETMASIYQKSGREDLAAGIRQNITKQQTG